MNLAPPAALEFGMAIHELATNAVRYGSLPSPGDVVTVIWQHDDLASLVLHWVETGGPTITPPAVSGSGTMLIEPCFVHDLSGEAKLGFSPIGLRAMLSAPPELIIETRQT